MLHTVRIEPPPPTWPGLIDQRDHRNVLGRPMQEWREITRHELLGESIGRIVATGHQAGFWHPGILAKYHAMDAAAEALEADAVVEILVDQDVQDLRTIRIPVIDGEGILASRALPWSHWPEDEMPRPTSVEPPILAEPSAWRVGDGEQYAMPQTSLQCRAMGRALVLLRSARSRAEQFALAAALLREINFVNRQVPTLGAPTNDPWRTRRFMVQATALPSTSLWKEMIRHLQRDPQPAWEAYNRAVAGVPNAGIMPLEKRASGGCEMPCWLITPDGQRHRAFEHDLRRRDALLLPRALLMTGLVRLALADLFIHGTGGVVYDQITEKWFAEWLGCDLAPDTMVTATMTLDIDRKPADERDLARGKWLIHHLPFNVDRFLDDPAPLRERERLINEIETLPHGSAQRKALFDQMRTAQHRLSDEHSDLIKAARENLRITQRRADEGELLHDRTWAFPLHPHSAILEMRDSIRTAFAV